MPKAPVVKKNHIQGTKRYKWRRCPYYTNDASDRIPAAERADHPQTEGKMRMATRAGYGGGVGWVCDDDNCPYYKGLATTAIDITTTRVEIDQDTGEYTMIKDTIPQLLCSGTRFWEN
jgi:hypothetical protein